MNPVDLIVKKRDGGELSRKELDSWIQGMVDGSIPDYQVAAWAMAVYFRGMTIQEATDLTLAMAHSGETLSLQRALPADLPIVDKHSSGGVGDKTTLAVGPIVAACGLPVGKMSGRGLSFTGGTIDKLESIEGWSADLDEDRFLDQLRDVGLVVAAQTASLAPADKQLYALRDVTGTVPSLPLIAASIMSKKLAAGAEAILLDVKCGRGAFMEEIGQARELAKLMVAIGEGAGRRVTALITRMDQPLGRAVGNALEVKEAIATLQGNGPADFQELVEAVSVEMLALADSISPPSGESSPAERVARVMADGSALERFRRFVVAQGGRGDMVDDPGLLPAAPVVLKTPAPRSGWVSSIDARRIGLTVVELGGGRRKKGDPIDYGVGVECVRKVGQQVEVGEPLARVHAQSNESAQAAVEQIQQAYEIGARDLGVETGSIVIERHSV